MIFHSHGDVTITGEGLQILTYTWHIWSLNNEGSISTNCDTVTNGIQLEWSSPRTETLTPVAERLAVELSLPVFTT